MASQKICDTCGEKENSNIKADWLHAWINWDSFSDDGIPNRFDLCEKCGKHFKDMLKMFVTK